MDYVLAYLAWDLNLMDLKQLCLNSIEFAAISEADKQNLTKFFNMKWKEFLVFVRGKYWRRNEENEETYIEYTNN